MPRASGIVPSKTVGVAPTRYRYTLRLQFVNVCYKYITKEMEFANLPETCHFQQKTEIIWSTHMFYWHTDHMQHTQTASTLTSIFCLLG